MNQSEKLQEIAEKNLVLIEDFRNRRKVLLDTGLDKETAELIALVSLIRNTVAQMLGHEFSSDNSTYLHDFKIVPQGSFIVEVGTDRGSHDMK